MNRCIDRRLISLNKNLSKTFYQPLEPKNRIQRRLIFSDDRCIAKRSMSFFAKLCEIFHCHLRFFSNNLLYSFYSTSSSSLACLLYKTDVTILIHNFLCFNSFPLMENSCLGHNRDMLPCTYYL